VRAYIRIRDNDTCQICGRKYGTINNDQYFTDIHIDHIIPFSKGGRNHVRNYQLTCSTCNKKKGDKIIG
jgi:5-methylcytosine-specific restriction endonuclease McrA